MADTRPRVAIACQGGGSHTAFSAGALGTLLGATDDFGFVAFSGTSGGAIDALLAWSSVLRDGGRTARELLWAFWDDMSATSPPEALLNTWSLLAYRALSPVVAPEVNPYLYPEVAGKELRRTIEDHVDFAELRRLAERHGGDLPMLLVGAVDVLSGDFRVFRNSSGDGGVPTLEVSPEAVLASAAVPTLFRAVAVDQPGVAGLYWDGLFSQNPPVRDLPDARPDQIWVLQINPTERATEPRQMGDIRDRRNELAGNLSLRQELHFIEKVNKLVRGWKKENGIASDDADAAMPLVEIDAQGNEKRRSYKEIRLRCIQLPEQAGIRLDTESKLDRDPAFIRTLFDTGRREAEKFLASVRGDGDGAYRWRDDR